jgi:hypothetical protein
MLGRRPQTGGDQQRAELGAVQRDGMRLVIQPRTADMGGWGMLQEFFFDRVPVEPGDGTQPPRHRGTCPALGFEFPSEAFDVGAAGGEQVQAAGAAPGGELAQVECVGLLARPRYPARNPARASRSGSVKAGWIVASAVDGVAVVIGHLPAGLEPGQLGLIRPQRSNGNPNVSRPPGSRYATRELAVQQREPGKCSIPADLVPIAWRSVAGVGMRRSAGSGSAGVGLVPATGVAGETAGSRG